MYLIVITKKKNVGSLLGHAVWKAVDFDMISYKKTVLHLTETQVTILFLNFKAALDSIFITLPPLCMLEASRM